MTRAIVTPRLPVALLALLFLLVATVAFARPVHANTYYSWYNVYSGKCLDVPYGNYYYGQKVQQYDCNGGQNQLFDVEVWGTNQVSLCSPSGYCIGRQQSAVNGAKAILVYDGCASYGCWRQVSKGGAYRSFQSLYDYRCLDDPGYSTANGAWQQVYDCNGGTNQIWSNL
jgi:Ricin-type beta-trefoil lectin domain